MRIKRREIFIYENEEWQVIGLLRKGVFAINLTDTENNAKDYYNNSVQVYCIDYVDIKRDEEIRDKESKEDYRVDDFISSQK